MADAISLELITPSALAAKVSASEVTLPGLLGEFTVLPGHAPYVAQIRPGIVRYRSEGSQHSFVLGSGFVEVSENRLLVLARSVEARGDLDEAATRDALVAAEAAIQELGMDSPQYPAALDQVEVLRARLQMLSS